MGGGGAENKKVIFRSIGGICTSLLTRAKKHIGTLSPSVFQMQVGDGMWGKW